MAFGLKIKLANDLRSFCLGLAAMDSSSFFGQGQDQGHLDWH